MAEENDEEENRKHYRFGITLRLFHPDADPDDITNALGIRPKRAWRAGEPRSTPIGQPLPGLYRETYWYKDVGKGEYRNGSLVAALSDLAETYKPFERFFKSFRGSGGRIEFFVHWIFYHNSGDVFDFGLLGKLADLGIDLSFDVYASDGMDLD